MIHCLWAVHALADVSSQSASAALLGWAARGQLEKMSDALARNADVAHSDAGGNGTLVHLDVRTSVFCLLLGFPLNH